MQGVREQGEGPGRRPSPVTSFSFIGAGGAGRDRTDDLYNAIVALSQLSYGPMECCSAAVGGGRGGN